MSVTASHVGVGAALAIFAVALLLGTVLTSAAVSWTRRRGILDHPNERSSHERPTPRGGGISIVALTLAAELVAWRGALLPGRECAALAAGGALVAVIGAWDDVRSISARARLPVQIVAAAAAVVLIGSSPDQSGVVSVVRGAIDVVGIVWMTNLYNFMDGIDGIAGIQGVAAGVGAAAVLAFLGSPGLALLALVVAGACAGFLTRNWSPARIFMGDVGSGFLGFTFGTLTAAAVRSHGAIGYLVLLPLVPFIGDATMTLMRRASRRAPLTEAHREHLYQRAVIAGIPHSVVAAAFGVVAALLALVARLAVQVDRQWALLVVAGALITAALLYAAALAVLRMRSADTAA